LVDLLDYYGAVEAVFAVLRRQCAGHDDGAFGHAALQDLARLAVIDSRALADVDAHRDYAAAPDDHAFDDLGASADEAVVLDDRRRCLERLEHAADADAARQVHVAADLRAAADRRPRIDH